MSKNMPRILTGRILDLQFPKDGYPTLKLDNGPTKVINIATTLENYPILLEEDLQAIHQHLMVRREGRFRVKRRDQ